MSLENVADPGAGLGERAGVTKWPDTQNEEARGEGPKPLPMVRWVK